VTGARFDHLLALSDRMGTFEHADHAEPRREHGYCTDDVARVLVAVSREPVPGREVLELARVSFRFLADSQGVNGAVRNRRDHRGRWRGRRSVEDCWGRSVWAFGTAARRAPEAWMQEAALVHFHHGMQQRSPWRRAMAFAALGAAEVLDLLPGDDRARRLLADAIAVIGRPTDDPAWRWPEPRLHYANAVLAEALLAAGVLLGRDEAVDDGLAMLEWLLERETVDGHLSPTPVGGAGPADRGPRFDQQPIEVAAMADACARALAVTGDVGWRRGVDLAVGWFDGGNDAAAPMWDPSTGAGFDGLEPGGPNLNRGAESTIAAITTMQRRALAHT
jgi:hypothetical protein